MQTICRFCDILKGNTSGEENQIITQNNDYFSIASVGALVEGWVLVVPKEHKISLKSNYCEEQFIQIVKDMLSKLSKQYNSHIIVFEHGPNKCNSDTSCGTNHAHLHLVPYNGSLYDDMLLSGLDWERCSPAQIESQVGTNEYLFYCDINRDDDWRDQKGYLHILKQPISQYFRKIIAKQLNKNDEYDYKKYPQLALTLKTYEVLANIH